MSFDKALVLGDDTRSFLAIVRSLGRRGVEVHAAPRRWNSAALCSRYITALHDLPAWSDGSEAWLLAVEALLRTHDFALVIPCDETTLLPLARYRERLGRLARLAIPDDAAIDVLFDKHATRELAAALGVPISPGRLPRSDDTTERVVAEFGLPLMLKPRRSFALDAMTQRGAVRSIANPAVLAELLPTLDPADTLLEAFVPGRGLGVSVLARDGRILQIFQHHRVREDTSGSYYRVSAPASQRYRDAVAAIVSALRYTGVGMFEFRADETTGSFVLLEVNARPWGSMPLAIHAGVDFPWAWFRLLTAGEELPPMPVRAGLYGRNLIPDLHAILRGAATQPLRMGLRLAEFARVLIGRERHDVLVSDDLRPGLTEVRHLISTIMRPLALRLPGAVAVRGVIARKRARRALANLAPGRPVLFVCQGNICRSPFAAAQMRRCVADAALVGSAGLLGRADRPSPEEAVAVATAHGVDLSAHRSVFLSRAMAASAALIVVFDRINVGWLAGRYPDLETPVVMLGHLVGDGDLADPVDGNETVFAASYDRIAAGVRALADLLPR